MLGDGAVSEGSLRDDDVTGVVADHGNLPVKGWF